MKKNIDALFDQAGKLVYDEACGMIPVRDMKGPGFFPGCIGTFSRISDFLSKPVMVLGQDFDTRENHDRIDAEKGEVDSNATWRNLKTLLHDVDIDLDACFFTNAYMGLRKENGRNTGRSPASKSLSFVVGCQEFFKTQLREMKPEIVLVLGKEPARFVSQTFSQDFPAWQNIGTLSKFYDTEDNIGQILSFENRNILFLFVLHPSMSNTNRALLWKKDGKSREITLLMKYLEVFHSRRKV